MNLEKSNLFDKSSNDKEVKITMEGIKSQVTDTGITIYQVLEFIRMNGTAYRDEILGVVQGIYTEEDIERDNKSLIEDRDLWIELADM